MPKLYLLGGENVHKRSAKPVNQAAFEEAGKKPRVLVFPWARASFDNGYRKHKILEDYFLSLGAGSVGFMEYGQTDGIAEKLANAELVYLTGGQPSILLERVEKMGLDDLLKTYEGVVVGRSAGALALCSRLITTCRSNSKLRVINGFGLVDITLKAHYTPEKDEALKRFSLKETIYAVPKDSSLVYDNGEFSSIGCVYVFNGGQRHIFKEERL
jgi:dipeptidase E